MDEIVQNASKNKDNNKNIFYEKPELRDHLQKSIQTLEKMLHSNNELGKVFGSLEKDIEQMKQLDVLNDKFGQIEDVVVSLDNLMHVSEFEEVLEQMSSVSQRLANTKLDALASQVRLLDPGGDRPEARRI